MKKATKLRIQVVLLYSAWILTCVFGILAAMMVCLWTFIADLLEEALDGITHVARRLDMKYESLIHRLRQETNQPDKPTQEDKQEDGQEVKQEDGQEDGQEIEQEAGEVNHDTQASSEEKQKIQGE